jgi:uncharacterized membrane protein
MKDNSSDDVRFSEALALWLPGAFSLALMAFALVDLFTLPHLPIPWYQALMLIAILGATVHGALLRQRRRITLLEQSLAALAPKHTAA